ncbi:U3 snoRNP protein, partial [Coemansia sp. RSA 2703]
VLREPPVQLPAEADASGEVQAAGVWHELAERAAVLGVLERVAADNMRVLLGISQFSTSLMQTVSALSEQLETQYVFLRRLREGTKDEAGVWDDEATAALGLDAQAKVGEAAGSRVFWGAFHQVDPLVSVLGRALLAMAKTALRCADARALSVLLDAWRQTVDGVAARHAANAALMEGLAQTAGALRQLCAAGDDAQQAQVRKALDAQAFTELLSLTEENLLSFHAPLRRSTLQLLAYFDAPLLESPGASSETCGMVALALQLEETEAGFDTYKERMNYLRRMAVLAVGGRVSRACVRVFPYVALAQLSVNMRPVWGEAATQLARLTESSEGGELLWTSVWHVLHMFSDERRLVARGLTPAARRWLGMRRALCDAQTAYDAASAAKLDGRALECPN